jgi:hypothetical protein
MKLSCCAPVYVVGADAGDLKTKQFWIDQKRVNPKLDPAIFDPRQFAKRHWEK